MRHLDAHAGNDHIAELETLIGAEGKVRRIILDLKDVTLTGQDGIALLALCERAGIALVNCDLRSINPRVDHQAKNGSRRMLALIRGKRGTDRAFIKE